MTKLLSLFLCLVLLVGLLPMAAPARAATALAVSSVKAGKTSAGVGATVTWTASASGGSGTLQYYFILYKDGTKIKTRSYDTANTFSYTPEEAGSYKVRVYVKDADGTKVNKLSAAVTVAPLTLSSVKADKTSAGVGATITWTASASGGTGTLRYYFNLYKDGTKLTARAYSTVNTFSYTPAEAGSYKVRVYVKDTDGTKVSKLSAVVTVAPLTLSSVKADKTSADTEEKITWTATASGGTGTLKYYFILYKDGSKITTRSYSTAKSFSYTPTEAGTYKVRVYVKDADGTKVNKLSGGVTVSAPISATSYCLFDAVRDSVDSWGVPIYFAQVIMGDGAIKSLPISKTTYDAGLTNTVYKLTLCGSQYLMTPADATEVSFEYYNANDAFTDYSNATFILYSGTKSTLNAGPTSKRPQAKSTVIIFYTVERSGTINVRKVKTVWFQTAG